MSVTKTKVTKIDGDEKVYEIRPATLVAFEKHFGIAVSDLKMMEQMYWIAWDAETRAIKKDGGVSKLFDDWINDIADVEDVSEKSPKGVRSRS